MAKVNFFDEQINSYEQAVEANKQQSLSTVQKKSYDEARAEVVKKDKELVKQLLDGLEIDEYVKQMLSVNTSTMQALSFERPEPTKTDKIQALWDFWKFIELINFHGGPLAFGDCHREVVEWSFAPEQRFRQLILEARGHLKSTLFSVARNLWRIYQNPNIRCFVGTESLKLSKAFIKEVEAELTNDWNAENVWNKRPHFDGPLIPRMDSLGKQRRLMKDISVEFGEVFQEGQDKKKIWRAEALQVIRTRNLKEPTITAGSVGQVSTGFHFDDVTFDDVQTFDNCSKPEKIDKVFSWIYDVESLLDPPYVDIELLKRLHSCAPQHIDKLRNWTVSGGRVYTIGTRYDELDYYGHIIDHKEKLGYAVHQANIYVNGKDNTDGYRWPEKWNEKVEEQTRAQFERKFGSTGLQRFYSQYMNQIIVPEDSVLNWDNIIWEWETDYKLDETGKYVLVYDNEHKVCAQFKPRLIVDPAATTNTHSDYTAMAVGGVYKEHLYVCDFRMGKYATQAWIDVMYEFIEKWNLYEAVIEMVGGFNILDFTIKKMFYNDPDKYRVIAIKKYAPSTTGTGKKDRIETVLSPLFHNSMVHLPRYLSRNSEFRKQILLFGKDTVHDDGPDVLAILKEMAFANIQLLNSVKPTYRHVVNAEFGGIEYLDGVSYA